MVEFPGGRTVVGKIDAGKKASPSNHDARLVQLRLKLGGPGFSHSVPDRTPTNTENF